MSLNEYISTFLEEDKDPYESIKQNFNFYKCIRHFGRAVTLYELVTIFMKQAERNGTILSREKVYLALTHAMNDQLFNEDITVKGLEAYSLNLKEAVKQEIKKNGEKYFDNELKVVIPKSLEISYEQIFTNYYTTRFLGMTNPTSAMRRIKESFDYELRNASEQVAEAAMDGETITMLAAFYLACLSTTPTEARYKFTENMENAGLVERMQMKYGLTDDDTKAMVYVLHKIVQRIAGKL